MARSRCPSRLWPAPLLRLGRRFGHLYRHSRLHLLEPVDHHPFVLAQAGRDDPCVAEDVLGLDWTLHRLVVGADDKHGGLSFRVVADGAYRHQQRLVVDALGHAGAHEHARQKHVLRVREQRAHRHRAGARVDGGAAEL
jgi:hypothetical protein